MCATVAPWPLAGGLLISFTASAGHSPFSHAPLSIQRPLAPLDIAARDAAFLLDSHVRVASISADWLLASRAPALGRARRGVAFGEDIEPSLAMKAHAQQFPDVDRRLKGDLLLALRPSLSRAAPPDFTAALTRIAFEPDEGDPAPGVFRVRTDRAGDRRK